MGNAFMVHFIYFVSIKILLKLIEYKISENITVINLIL